MRDDAETYRGLFDHMMNGFAYCRMLFEDGLPVDWIYLKVNRAFEEQTGLVGVVGRRVSEVIPGIRETNPDLFDLYGRVALSGKPERLETYVETLKAWFSLSVYSPQKEHFVAVFDVITERKKAEDAIRASEERWKTIVQNEPECVKVLDREGRLLEMNPAGLSMIQAPLERVVGQKVSGLVAEEDRPAFDEMVAAVFRGETRRLVFDMIGLEGRRLTLETTSVPTRYNTGTADVQALLAVTRDITERKRAEQELRDSEARYRSFFEMDLSGVYVSTPEGRILDCNPVFARMFGFESVEAALSASAESFYAAGDRERFLSRLRDEKALKNVETELIAAGGAKFTVLENVVGDFDRQGRLVRLTGFMFDITERKHAERQIARLTSLNVALGQINQAIVRTTDRETLFREICRIAVELGRFQFAWVGVVDRETGRVPLVEKFGTDGGYLDGIRVTVDPDDPWGRGPTGTAIREAEPCISQDFLNDPRTVTWQAAAARAGVRGVAAFPLKAGGEVVAALTVYASEVDYFDEKTVALLGEIADDISYALENLDREARRRAAERALRASEEFLRHSQSIARLGRYALDVPSGVWTSSEILDDIFGIGPDYTHDLAGWAAIVHPEDREEMVRYFAEEVLGKGLRFEKEYRIVRRVDGEERWVSGLGELERDANGRITRMVGTIQDVTERHRSEERFRLWSHVLESSAEGILVTDAKGTILNVNRAFAELTGYPDDEAVGRTPEFLESGQHGPEFTGVIRRSIAETGRWQGEVLSRKKNGEVFPVWLSVTAVRGGGGALTHFIGIFSDITERKQSAERIQYVATHDFLTGLPNRSLLDDLLREAVARAGRHGGSVGVLFLDLDRFKTINDSLGHLSGDILLQRVAERLGGCLRAGDTVSRLGGDEFLTLLPEIGRAQDAAAVAEKILEAMRGPFSLAGREVSISPSIGIAVYPDDGEDVVTLVKNADAAMYHAKERGRNNYQFFTPDMNARAFEALAMESSLRRALEREEFLLVYQPQVEVATGRIIGVEGLIRWRHPDMGLVLPGRFIPVAEERGLIVSIGEWVLKTACRQIRAWLDAGLPAVPVAVNVSALQFQSGQLAGRLGAILSEAGVAARYLELELTESIVMREAESTISVLARLKEMGVRLAIDDFGTGFSSLSYLGRLPIDRLKIDQSFVRNAATSHSARAIISAIVNMARSLGLGVIAEGVETDEQLAFLRSQGCEEVQGYLLSYPVPASDIAELLKSAGATRRLALPARP